LLHEKSDINQSGKTLSISKSFHARDNIKEAIAYVKKIRYSQKIKSYFSTAAKQL